MKTRINKDMNEALDNEFQAMEAMEGEFGESEPAAFDKSLIPDEELESISGGILFPLKTTASPIRPTTVSQSSPQIR